MKKLIILRGPLGVGKTTVAKKLGAALNARVVSIDFVLEKHGLDQTEEGEGIPIKNFLKANEIILPQIKAALSEGKPAVIDGCFYHKEQIEHFIQNVDAPCTVFTLKASVETCIARDKEREKIYGEGAAMAVHAMVSRFDHGMVIDTEGKTPEETTEALLSSLARS